jgi:hydroxycarboxylate dehydrogenase B
VSAAIAASELAPFVAAIFAAAGSDATEAAALAEHLVDANLVGHESHGVIRVAKYLDWLRRDLVRVNRHARVAEERGPVLIVDGDLGYGQIIAREAMTLGIERARGQGIAIVAIRNTGHLGRIGAWPEQCAEAGMVSLHFVNTSGFGILVAPHGGSDRRLSANPIAAGAPVAGGAPLILDIATSAIPEGKIQVARNKGEALPEGVVLDGQGRPTRDPEAFYAAPPGAIFPFGGHKGSGLSLFCEILAGALTGGGSSHPDNPSAAALVNNMLSLIFDPAAFAGTGAFAADLERLVGWVAASPPLEPGGSVLLPGGIERRCRAERLTKGIPLDDETLRQLAAAAASVGIAMPHWH